VTKLYGNSPFEGSDLLPNKTRYLLEHWHSYGYN